MSFIRFDRSGLTVVKYFESHPAVAMPWIHEIDNNRGTCMWHDVVVFFFISVLYVIMSIRIAFNTTFVNISFIIKTAE